MDADGLKMENSRNVSESIDDEMEDSGITMVDVLQEEEELENDAEAVLGAGDDSSCTYNEGYMKRQPLYACMTCCPVSSNSVGGVCLGCSYHCHEGHDLVELYTKRYFRCDCGNSKYPASNPCKLIKDKGSNEDNVYNANFEGKYCTCARPYPDPEDKVEDSMIQCIICEDWFHGRHLKVDALPGDEDYSEMICHLCVPKLSFLRYYLGFAVTAVSKNETKTEVDVETTKSDELEKEEVCETDGIEKAHSLIAKSFKKGNCKLKSLAERDVQSEALFMMENWRKELCLCADCIEMYRKLKVSFLTDEEDTVSFYECEGRAKRRAARGAQRELEALSSLDRFTRTEIVHEYNNLSSSLRDYLKKFADNGKVVRDEDIREFFSQLSAQKKQKKQEMQYFCK